MQEDIFILIESYRLELTDVEQVIADYFLSKKAPLTIDKLSKELAVSKASITRFAKKIGLNNYKELIFLYNLSLNKDEDETLVSNTVTSLYHSLATRSSSNYVEEDVDKFCHYINQHKIIHFLGMGFNSYAAMDFQFKFSRLGKYVRVISDENSIAMSTEFAEKDELIIACSLRGVDENMLKAIKIAKKRGISVLLITGNANSPLIKEVDVTLLAATLTREESLGSISPQIPILIQQDIVYERYIHLYSDSVKKWLQSEAILTNKFDNK
ncbi:MurR/RpiR family transcriptional regulator [Vagococcus fluvialis]|uniref:MurR/RpiR family transcriptional regulator n=1 Tax=Vagococcus fluvialis TaxID=2738 RepID=UPI003D1084F7